MRAGRGAGKSGSSPETGTGYERYRLSRALPPSSARPTRGIVPVVEPRRQIECGRDRDDVQVLGREMPAENGRRDIDVAEAGMVAGISYARPGCQVTFRYFRATASA